MKLFQNSNNTNQKSPRSVKKSIQNMMAPDNINPSFSQYGQPSLDHENTQNRRLKQSKSKQNLIHKQNENKRNFKKIEIGQNIQKNIDFGLFNSYRLDQFFDVQNTIDQGCLIPVVTVGSHALHLQEKFLNFMEKFMQFQLIFVGVYGQSHSGKSLFLDKILNLATFQGSHFTQSKKQKNICMWSIPISRGKQKIFLVDCSGYDSSENSTREEEMLCDFLMFLCSEIIIVPPFNDAQNAYCTKLNEILKCSLSRLQQNKISGAKDSFYWPYSLHVAYRTQCDSLSYKKLFLKSNLMKLGQFKDPQVDDKINGDDLKQILLGKYADRKKKFISQAYLKCISQIVKNLYEHSHPKFYKEVKPNGSGMSILLLNFVLSVNCKQKINICSIIQKTKNQILSDTYNSSVNWYTKFLERQLNEQKPKNSNELLTLFQNSFFKTLKYFRTSVKSTLTINSDDKDQIQHIQHIQHLETKLQKHMRQKQVLILKINQKKTLKYLKPLIDKKVDLKQMPMQQIMELRQILYKSKTVQRKLDVNRLLCIKQKMIEGWNKFIMNENIKHKEQLTKLQLQLQGKKQQLKIICEKNHQTKMKMTQTLERYNKMNREQGDLLTKVQNLKFEINIHKKSNKERLENSYEKIHMVSKNQQQLLAQLKEYEQKLMKRQKEKSEELKQLRDQLEQAYKIEGQQMKKMNPKSTSFFNISGDNNINAVSNYELVSKEKIASKNNLNQYQQSSQLEQSGNQAMFSSRIARNTQSIRLLKQQISKKNQTVQQLKQKLSSSYVNLSRINTEYKNNKVRATQSRKVKVQKAQKKQEPKQDTFSYNQKLNQAGSKIRLIQQRPS